MMRTEALFFSSYFVTFEKTRIAVTYYQNCTVYTSNETQHLATWVVDEDHRYVLVQLYYNCNYNTCTFQQYDFK